MPKLVRRTLALLTCTATASTSKSRSSSLRFASAVPIAAMQWEGRSRWLCIASGRHVYVLANALGLKACALSSVATPSVQTRVP